MIGRRFRRSARGATRSHLTAREATMWPSRERRAKASATLRRTVTPGQHHGVQHFGRLLVFRRRGEIKRWLSGSRWAPPDVSVDDQVGLVDHPSVAHFSPARLLARPRVFLSYRRKDNAAIAGRI